jgi:hypothetical protein
LIFFIFILIKLKSRKRKSKKKKEKGKMLESWKQIRHPVAVIVMGGGIGTYLSTMGLLYNAPGTLRQKSMFAACDMLTWPVVFPTFNVTERYFKAIGLHRDDYAAYLRDKHLMGNW